jgi:hypothetical protein
MSLSDENLKDEYLRKALQHAPDSDVAPSELVRKTVLDYADKAVKTQQVTQHESWFVRVKNKFNSWKIPSWQLTGMGSLAASLLVVVMIWHENPNDPIQVASAPATVTTEAAPKPAPTLTQGELANNQLEKAEESAQSAAAPVAASAETAAPELPASKQASESNQDKAEAKIAGKTEPTKQKAELAPQVAAIEQSADKAIVASVPEAASANAEKDAFSRRAKAREQNDAVAMSAPAPTAPAAPVAVETAPISEPKSASATVPIKKMADATAQSEASAKQDSSSASGNIAMEEKRQKSKKRLGDDPLADALVQNGGATMAKQDIEAGKLRLLDTASYYKGKPSDCTEPYIAGFEPSVDAKTAYNIEVIYVCVTSQQLIKEVALYNQTMREWHAEEK